MTASTSCETEQAITDLLAGLAGAAPALVLYFASARHDLGAIAEAMHGRYPRAVSAGCTTMGEIGPAGPTRGGVAAIAIDGAMRAAGALVELAGFRYETGSRLVADLAAQLGLTAAELNAGQHCLVTMTDGLSGMEEILIAALGRAAPGVPLVGGSAGDDFRFERTWVALDGRAATGSAVVLLLQPNRPFAAFHVHHFRPTDARVVVTRATPERRLVHELDGWPAVERLAALLGVSVEQLRSDATLAGRQVPFGFAVGGEYFLRSVMTVQKQSLLMGGAVEEGTVLRVMERGDLVAETAAGIGRAIQAVGGKAAGAVLFSCGGRVLEAESSGVVEAMTRAMCVAPSAGFTTYGEQYGPLQLNHTLTGILLGEPR